MPIFEFKCKNCGWVFEELYTNGDSLPTKCSKCGGELVRVYSGSVGLSFKGSGFYVNDYGKSCSTCKASTEESSDKK